MKHLSVILVRTKSSENIGSVARACMNMGCCEIILVQPRNFNIEKALPLATVHATDFLISKVKIVEDLKTAIDSFQLVIGTTARTGGWRRNLLTPDQVATKASEFNNTQNKIALVFGPEDTGLSNSEICLCHQLVCIPTADLHSLNLSHAVMILLYLCKSKIFENPLQYTNTYPIINANLRAKLESTLQETLTQIDFFHGENTDYFMQPLKRFLTKINMQQNEFNMLMGILRQIQNLASLTNQK